MANSIIYKSLNTLMSVLKSEQNITSTEILELITIYNKTNCGSSIIERKNPLIVFEGLDGSGKSTIMKVLNEKINCKTVSTPPESIKHLREFFNDKPPELRRAFYSLGNYIVAEEIKLLLKEGPVLMDRFWHSTCVSALANDVADSTCLPAVDSDLYRWPDDLLKPDVVIFLNVPEHIRIERLSRRKNYTAEEDRLKNDDCFRNVWFTAFERMRDPAVLKVESMATPKKCAQYILNRLTAMGLVLPPRKN